MGGGSGRAVAPQIQYGLVKALYIQPNLCNDSCKENGSICLKIPWNFVLKLYPRCTVPQKEVAHSYIFTL